MAAPLGCFRGAAAAPRAGAAAAVRRTRVAPPPALRSRGRRAGVAARASDERLPLSQGPDEKLIDVSALLAGVQRVGGAYIFTDDETDDIWEHEHRIKSTPMTAEEATRRVERPTPEALHASTSSGATLSDKSLEALKSAYAPEQARGARGGGARAALRRLPRRRAHESGRTLRALPPRWSAS